MNQEDQNKLKEKVQANKASNSADMQRQLSEMRMKNLNQPHNSLKDRTINNIGSKAISSLSGGAIPPELSKKMMENRRNLGGQNGLSSKNGLGLKSGLGGLMSGLGGASLGKSMLGSMFGSMFGGKNKGSQSEETETPKRDVEGNMTFGQLIKLIKTVLIISIPVFTIIIFVGLFMSAGQVYEKVIGFGNADNVTTKDADEKIKESIEDGTLDEELGFVSLNENDYVYLDKVEKVVNIKRRYNEADITKLKEFYGDSLKISEGDDLDSLYNFYFKLYDIYHRYLNLYCVKLDMPLLMATLIRQTDDLNLVYSSNLNDYDRDDVSDTTILMNLDWEYDYSKYIENLRKNVNNFDIQILAKNMVTKTTVETCTDSDGNVKQTKESKNIEEDNFDKISCGWGERYNAESKYEIDYDHYKEFLREYLEKKYYSEDSNKPLGLFEKFSGNYSTRTFDRITTNLSSGCKVSSNDNSNHEVSEGDWATWKQCDPRWGSKKIGNSTVCSVGCYMTSMGIITMKSGTSITKTFDPGVLADTFVFAKDGSYIMGLNSIAPNFVAENRIYTPGWSKEQIANKLRSYPDNYYFLLRVRLHSRSSLHHFVAVNYVKDNNDIVIYDTGRNCTDLYSCYAVGEIRPFKRKD